MKSKARKILLLVVKLAIAAALLWAVVSKVHWNDYTERQTKEGQPQTTVIKPGFKTVLVNMQVAPAIGALAAYGVSVFFLAVRWRLLLAVQEVHISLWQSVRLTFLGLFFNTVIPGTMGGDFFKAYYVARQHGHGAGVLMSIFYDRAIGMTVLTLLSATMLVVALAGGLSSPEQLHTASVSIVVISGVLVAAGVFLLSRRFRRVLHLQKLYGRLPIAHHIKAAGKAVQLYRHNIPSLLIALGVSLICHMLFVLSILALGAALSVDIAWYEYFIYIPLIYVIGSVPVTPGGLGLIEVLYTTFFTVNVDKVLAMALLARLVPIITSLPGLGVFMSGPRPPKAETIEAELESGESQAVTV